ncbi:ABC transporter ATP-binding protein [Nisaea sediminum]|uniref:ABC transporter ATP-binding protein n=1 Tax=Nisaea sediminum TaxID=2775867 RepID=UPI00186854F7|nr:ABC transporter ATP-binding protein [Nisaea sediminum]
MSVALLELRNVSILRGGGLAVDNLDLSVSAGEIVALLGLNGAGKSSLLRSIMGLEPLEAGSIRFRDRDLGPLETAGRARLGIGYCPEGRRLFPGMSVLDTLHAASRATARERDRRIEEITRLFPLLDHILEQECWRLSGGQQQVVAIARALMSDPDVLLLDEPSLGLAPVICQELFPTIRRLADRGNGVLLAEQSLTHALSVADRVAVLHRGRLVLDAPVGDVSHDRLKHLLLSEGEHG